MNWQAGFFDSLAFLLLAYLICQQAISTVLVLVGWSGVNEYVRRRPLRAYGDVATSPLSMPVSILVPAYNEEQTIVASVRSLLRSQYLQLEIVIISDGSSDATLDRLISAFRMAPLERVPSAGLSTAPVRGTYLSSTHRNVVLVDKANGGKADALNAGLNYARYPLVCAIDADTLLDRDSLARLVWEFQAEPSTVAVGGIVRVVNGSRFAEGRMVEVRTPPGLLANVQVIEYLRAFLGSRVAWSRMGMLLIVSGAFGLFRRQSLIEAGGYDPTTVGEDAEMVLRLYRRRAEAGLPCRITFFPDPICWTQVPDNLRMLTRQRDRWQRGLAQMLWRHRDMLFRRRYGRIGSVALPYFWIFELFAPVIEVFGTIMALIGLAAGALSIPLAVLLLLLSTAYGLALSLTVILMEERAFLRYPNWKDLAKLTGASVAENFGYHQYLTVVRFRSFWTLLRNRGWGEMQRSGFGSDAPAGSGESGGSQSGSGRAGSRLG